MARFNCPAWSCFRGTVVNAYDHEGPCGVCGSTGFIEVEEKTLEFEPAFDMPNTREQALAVLKAWISPTCVTFSASRTKRIHELLIQPAPDVAKLVDHIDLMADEFIRIKVLRPSPEIVGLCERALTVTKQTVPVIEQRDKLDRKVKQLLVDVAELVEILKAADALLCCIWRDRTMTDYAFAQLQAVHKSVSAALAKHGGAV